METDERVARVEERLSRIERFLGLAPGSATLEPRAAPVARPPRERPRVSEAATPLVPDLLEPVGTPSPAAVPAPVAAVSAGSVPAAPPPPLPAPPPLPPAPPEFLPDEPTPAPRTTPGPERRPRVVAVAKRKGDLERVVGVAVVGRVGIASLLLAAAYFGKLAWDAVSPEARVAGIYGLAAALVGVGAWLRPRVAPKFTALLWGGGVAAAYLAGVVAKLRYDLVGPLPAVAMLAAACALGQFLARVARLPILAQVALAGAYAAPVLVGSHEDARTALLVYLLALHAWAVVTERRFGWTGARATALVATGIVGGLWLDAHGDRDVSTYLHVHAYGLGLLFPEILDGLAGRRLSEMRVGLLTVVAVAAEAGALVGSFGRDALCAFGVLAGISWIGLGAAWRRASGDAAFPGVRAVVRLGGCLLALGVIPLFQPFLDQPDLDAAILTSLSAVAVGLVLARPWLSAGDGPAALAGTIALLVLPGQDARHVLTAVSLLGPAALVVLGKPAALRQIGLVLAVATCFVGLDARGDAGALLRGFGAASAVLAATAVLARRRADAWLLTVVDAVGVCIAGFWAWHAFAGRFEIVGTPLANEGTIAAVLLALAVAVRRPWTAPSEESPVWDVRAIAGFAAVGVLALAGWREVHSATGGIPGEDARIALRALYVAVASAALLVASRQRAVAALAVPAILGLGLAAVLSLSGLGFVRDTAWTAIGVGGVALVATGAAIGASGSTPASRAGGMVVVACLLATWAVVGWAGLLPAPFAFGNARFALGIGLLAALFLSRRAAVESFAAAIAPWRAGLLALAVFAVGWVDLRHAISGLSDPHAKDALASVYGTLAAAVTLAVGFKAKAAHLRWLALSGFGAVVLKVGFHDLASVDTPFRVLVTGALGLVLLLAAYAYARRTRAAAGDDPPPGGSDQFGV